VRYVELCFTVPESAVEGYVEALIAAGAAGVEERDASTLGPPQPGTGSVYVWVDPAEVPAFLERVREAARGLPEPAVKSRDRDEDEWRDAWKRHFRPRRVGCFVIVPSWETYAGAADEILLHLDPGRAFGTGGHASTRLCLEALSDRELACARFLDVGCGSGVLAIACAARFPDAKGVGVDVDPDAVEVSHENATRNRVADRIALSTDPVGAVAGAFDVVTANIQPEVLIPMAPSLAERVAPGGRVILAGILVEAAPPVADAFGAQGLSQAGSLDDEGWRCLVFQRRRLDGIRS
jgi:ribosomal protein L11 methyltransferase